MFHRCITLCLEDLLRVWLERSACGRWEITVPVASSPYLCWTVQFNFTLTHTPAQCPLTSPASKPVLVYFIFPGLHETSLVCSRPSVLPYPPVSLAGSVIAAFSPWIPASASCPPLHAFLSAWSLACGSCFLILPCLSSSFLAGTQLRSLLIPAAGSCSLVLQQGAGSWGHSSLICLFACVFIEHHSVVTSPPPSFLPQVTSELKLWFSGWAHAKQHQPRGLLP